jgi:cell division protein FtsZ
MKFDLPKDQSSIIKVIGIGGGGSNAVNHMYNQGISGVDFIICNTDQQALDMSPVPNKIQLGTTLTEGRGAGSNPEVGKNSAIENVDDIKEILSKNTQMVFITAGMGGGTGTGAAPILAQTAKEMGILTVGIVTIPFSFEGKRRKMQADAGLEELRAQVDTLLIICNDRLREMYGNLKISEAFSKADDILTIAAKGIAEIITVAGYVNVDFEDVKTVMKGGGTAIMGSATAQGDDRATKAVSQALASPLLNDNDITGANYILLNITSGEDEISMDEVDEITDYIQNEAGYTADLIWGNGKDESLGDKICVTIIATGFGNTDTSLHNTAPAQQKIVRKLDDEVPTAIVDPTNEPKENTFSPNEEERNMEPFLKSSEKEQQDELSKEEQVTFNFEPQSAKEPELKQAEPPAETPNKVVFSLDDTPSEKKDEEPTITPTNISSARSTDDEEQLRRSQERILRLRALSMKMKTSSGISELENEPAYKRREIELNNTPHSSESEVSRYTLSESEEDKNKVELKDNNSFLHDNVD